VSRWEVAEPDCMPSCRSQARGATASVSMEAMRTLRFIQRKYGVIRLTVGVFGQKPGHANQNHLVENLPSAILQLMTLLQTEIIIPSDTVQLKRVT